MIDFFHHFDRSRLIQLWAMRFISVKKKNKVGSALGLEVACPEICQISLEISLEICDGFKVENDLVEYLQLMTLGNLA